MTTVAAYQDVAELSQTAVIDCYAPLVKRIAYHLLARLPKSVQVEDLIQAGMLGLLGAAKNYDASRGASFETYASIRVRGSMLDEVRRNDWTPRSVHRNARMIEAAIRSIEHETGKDAKDADIAKRLGIPLTEYHSMLRDCKGSQVYAFDDIGLDEARFTQSLSARSKGPLEGVERDKFHRSLIEAIAKLPEKEQMVLSLYYIDEMNLKEIGLVFNVSESRICQIHSQAMKRLNVAVKDWEIAS